MHGLTEAHFFEQTATFLCCYYLMLAIMNGLAAFCLWQSGQSRIWFHLPISVRSHSVPVTNLVAWLATAIVFVVLAGFASSGNSDWTPALSETWRMAINRSTGPVIYSVGTTLGLAVLYVFRTVFVQPAVAWTIWNLMWLALGLSMADRNFYVIVAKPDNVPIAAMIFLLAFFTWLATHRAVINDQRKAQGEPPLEKLDDEKVLVWPDLVYSELICMIALTSFLILWAIALPAPLEEAANTAKTPVSSKAPWYFLGLQDMLVYCDPWLAGVVLPGAIVVGLVAIPYLDFNKAGNGYYTINERKFCYLVFQFGFLGMWIPLIVLGTFLRGPFWNFYGPFEFWDPHKVESTVNVYLSNLFWEDLLQSALPMAPVGSGAFVQFLYILLREAPGILLVAGYFIFLPPLLAMTILRNFYRRMGLIRYMIMANLLLLMAALPIKMILLWIWGLKYLIAIPEYFLNC